MAERHRWTRTSMIDEAVVSTETVSFTPNWRGVVPMPLEVLEELLFEAGYAPVASDEERRVGA